MMSTQQTAIKLQPKAKPWNENSLNLPLEDFFLKKDIGHNTLGRRQSHRVGGNRKRQYYQRT